MVAITLRADLSRGLDNAEIDANFSNLKTAVEAAAISAQWNSVVGRPTALSSFTNDTGFVTTAGARSAISATGSLSYNATTGVMSVSVPVTSVFGRTGDVTLGSGDVTTALGFTPYNSTNPSGFITSSASISGNAATSTKLATARTINGVSFDGTANISISAPASDVYAWAKAASKPSYTYSEVGAAAASHSHSYMGDGGSYGTLYLSNWFRSTGATGWYNETYSGGMYMSDTTWVRVYGGKSFLTDWHQFHGGGNIYTSSYGWLHDYFFRVTANCGSNTNNTGGNAINCYGGGNVETNRIHEVIDEGATLRLRTVRYYVNCNCSTDSCFLAGTQVQMADGLLKNIEDIAVGDLVVGGNNQPTQVTDVWRPVLGYRSMYSIGGHVLTTEDHLVLTTEGWACLNPGRYSDNRFMAPVAEGKVNSAIHPSQVKKLVIGDTLQTASGETLVVESIETRQFVSNTQLFSLFTEAGSFVLEGGVVVDGMAQPN